MDRTAQTTPRFAVALLIAGVVMFVVGAIGLVLILFANPNASPLAENSAYIAGTPYSLIQMPVVSGTVYYVKASGSFNTFGAYQIQISTIKDDGLAHSFAVHFRLRGVDGDAGEPASAAAIGCLRHELQAGQIPQPLDIAFEYLSSRRDSLIENLKLTSSDSRQDIAQSVIESQTGVLVVRRGIARLRCQKSGLVDQFRVIRYQHATP